jgi:hypothetical protein
MNQEPPFKYTPIAGAEKYVLTDSGFVCNLSTGKRLKRYWSSKGHYTLIPLGQGRLYRLFHKTPKIKRPEDHKAPPDLRLIPEYPNYGITPYGAVWRIQGKRNVTPHMVREEIRGDASYVQLLHISGKRHNRSVSKLVQQIWSIEQDDDED